MSRMTLSAFWEQRNFGTNIFLDRLINNVSVFIAFACYKLGINANQLSLASGISSIFAFCAALVLPPDQMSQSVVALYLLSQVSYLFDCADGQLARATGTTSEFGTFLDKSIDVASSFLCFGSFFTYVYRYFIHIDLLNEANLFLLVGFLFIAARTSRYFTWQMFSIFLPNIYRITKTKENRITLFLMTIMNHQISLFNMLMFLLWPIVCLGIFTVQAVILGSVYMRYFMRAWPS